MSSGVARILERALEHARRGHANPLGAIVLAAGSDEGDKPGDGAGAISAVQRVAGCALTKWYRQQRRTAADTVRLLEEALFQVQLGG
jgi:hypothetical protein